MQKYLVGTLFEEEEQSKKTNLSNMKAKDPMGNTRWKGAFTGGFQAGYKNTCGSKEGWAPAQFVSSVFKRSQPTEQKIFDYMDKEDLGKESITNNITLTSNYTKTPKNAFNITIKESIGQRILNNLKKIEAFNSAPENIEDLHKLLEIYSREDQPKAIHELRDLLQPYTVNASKMEVEDDDFIAAYEDFYKKVIKGQSKEETEEEIAKRKEENKIYFDFTRPLESEPEYLKQIQDVSEGKPQKRRKNLMNELSLRNIFKTGKEFKQFGEEQITKAPADYDPFHRIRQGNFESELMKKQSHKKLTVAHRSSLLGEETLSSRFISAKNIENTFVKNQAKVTELKKFFQDQKKNHRYNEYVQELQGKGISSQLENRSYEEIERERVEFEETYRLQSQTPKIIAEKKKSNLQLTRTIEGWRPEKLLCKRFNVFVPYQG